MLSRLPRLLAATRTATAARLCTSAKPNPTALCETSAGSFTVELFVDQMPITASNWIDLAQRGFYNGVHFHRVIPHFMAQFGCPNARDLSGHSGRPGTGGPLPNSTFTILGTGESVTRREHRGKGATRVVEIAVLVAAGPASCGEAPSNAPGYRVVEAGRPSRALTQP